MADTVLFVFFAVMSCSFGIMALSVKNPVHAVLSLLGAFVQVAALFIMMNASFLAMVLLLVHGGGLAVLFLFMLIMYDFKKEVQPLVKKRYLSFVSVLMVTVLSLLFHLFEKLDFSVHTLPAEDVKELGRLLFTDYLPVLEVMGLCLFVAMLGIMALVLPSRSNPPVPLPEQRGAERSFKTELTLHSNPEQGVAP